MTKDEHRAAAVTTVDEGSLSNDKKSSGIIL